MSPGLRRIAPRGLFDQAYSEREKNPMRGTYRMASMLGLLALAASGAKAQDIAETAIATSHVSAVASGIKLPTPSITLPSPTLASPATNGSSPHLVARTGPPPDEVNRKDFEDNAGEKAGKLLLRSVPTGADIFVNDRLVGKTPLLMVVAPGKYKVDMRGPREGYGHGTVGVMPKETQTVVINLNQRYPISVSSR